MFQPTGFADLAGKRVGIFGYGVEGRATRRRLEGLTASVVLVDDADVGDPDVLRTRDGGHEALLECDVVLKSPGIPRRRADVVDLEQHGVCVTSSLNLWLHDVERSRVIAITGTKGKSTTTALTTFFFDCVGETALRLGNIGQPPYDPEVDVARRWFVVEVSSFQCVDIDVAPDVVVVTSLGEDHLDWHGTLEDYRRDKLSLTRAAGAHRTLVPDTATFREIVDQLGGDVEFVEPDHTELATRLGLMGTHSNANVGLALEVVALLSKRSVDDVRTMVLQSAPDFEPLRGRLTLVATEGEPGALRRYVDDGLATSVLPAIVALEVFANEPVALIAGGFDRGVDYEPLARAIAARTSLSVLVSMGEAGRRLALALAECGSHVEQITVSSMRDAVVAARTSLIGGGVVLLSPGAPSFDQYKNWEERSEDFTRIVREITEN